ncbi:hypothetical protein FA048_04655 [Pedobacter polaris]|uniref:Hemolysin III n=1 Tax=Pedobacter polaris TaxID=2571273 RepID=A0A4V5P2I4_9SPHI|nr:hypothetical protein [Pedobacter polaris]TKC12912.1 hypothetical protein FA048_04655 [Pedobacter polaris]
MLTVQNPPDGGTLYAETNLGNLFPEPLNALTSCFFLAIAIYWTFKLWKNHQSHPFLTYCLILLYIGGIGGTTYHAFRQWPPFIMMDWVPIMLLCVSAGVYFMSQLIKWYYALLLVGAYVGFQFYFRSILSGNNMHLFININYAMMALLVLLPVLAYLIHTKWKDGKWVGIALISFVAALTFRIADKWEWLNTGTHFLWHTFGAMASFCMFNYIYLTGIKKENKN